MAAATAFRRTVELFINQNLTPEAQSAALAKVAREGLAELQRTGEASTVFRRYVDGKEGAAEESVKPDGVIVYAFDHLATIITFALSFLLDRAPPASVAPVSPAHGKPTHYRDGFALGLGGRMVAAKDWNPDAFDADGAGAEILIFNRVAYGRRLDVQADGGKRLKFTVPAGIWDDAAKEINRRFGGIVTATRQYDIDYPGKYALRTGKHAGKAVQSPGLILSPRR